MKKSVRGASLKSMLFIICTICSLNILAQSGSYNATPAPAPELVFRNPVLKSGTANKEGAIYRFSNVANGIDAEVKLKKFSRNDIVMRTIDNSTLGWSKAFQPEFGLDGTVAPRQNWYIDFEMKFYEAGTNKKQKLEKFVLTTLDVDGDGLSITEYAVLNNANSVAYSSVSYLKGLTSTVANIGQSLACQSCGTPSLIVKCSGCGGDGEDKSGDVCDDCGGSGKRQALCGHPYATLTTVTGPVDNFTNIDTLATQVMATYTYEKKDQITFRYGAKSGNYSSYGAGIRLNSMWYKAFNLAAVGTLPVKLTNFTARYDKKDVILNWAGHEENFSHYILQRSNDGKTYKDVAVIFATGNGTTEYRYKDANVSSSTGMIHYRLQLVDKVQEGIAYSDVRVIRTKEQELKQLSAYPNPVKDDLRLTLPSAWQGKAVLIELFTANGVKVRNIQTGFAGQTEQMSLASLSKGFYIVKATCEEETAQQRIIKD